MKKNIAYTVLAIALIAVIINIGFKEEKKENTIKIGVISTLTGNAAYYGQSTMKGAEVAKDEMQAKYPNVKIELVHEDSLFTPQGGLSAYHKLKDQDHVQAIMVQGSNIGVAVEKAANEDKMLQVDASVLATDYSTPNDMSFRMTADADQEAIPAAEYMLKSDAIKKPFKRLAIIYLKNSIGISLDASIAKLSKEKGIEVVVDEGYAPDTTDYKTILAKVKDTKADVVYVAGVAAQTAVILKEADELGIEAQFMSYRAAEDPTLIKNAGKLAEGIIYTSAYENSYAADLKTAKDKLMKEFTDEYSNKYPGPDGVPNGYAAEAYEGTKIIIEALIKCGDDKTCQQKFVSEIKDRPTVFGNISFDTNGDVTYPFFLKTVYEGGFVRTK